MLGCILKAANSFVKLYYANLNELRVLRNTPFLLVKAKAIQGKKVEWKKRKNKGDSILLKSRFSGTYTITCV